MMSMPQSPVSPLSSSHPSSLALSRWHCREVSSHGPHYSRADLLAFCSVQDFIALFALKSLRVLLAILLLGALTADEASSR